MLTAAVAYATYIRGEEVKAWRRAPTVEGVTTVEDIVEKNFGFKPEEVQNESK